MSWINHDHDPLQYQIIRTIITRPHDRCCGPFRFCIGSTCSLFTFLTTSHSEFGLQFLSVGRSVRFSVGAVSFVCVRSRVCVLLGVSESAVRCTYVICCVTHILSLPFQPIGSIDGQPSRHCALIWKLVSLLSCGLISASDRAACVGL